MLVASFMPGLTEFAVRCVVFFVVFKVFDRVAGSLRGIAFIQSAVKIIKAPAIL